MRFIMTLKPGLHRPAKAVRSHLDPNIEAQERAIKAASGEDRKVLADTMLILHQIRNGLPKSRSKT